MARQVPGQLQQADTLYQKYRQTEDVGAVKKAVEVLDAIEQSSPASYDVLWRLSRAYYGLADDTEQSSDKLNLFDRAIQSGKKAITLNPNGVEGHYWLGVSYGGYGEAKGMAKAVSAAGHVREEMETAIRLDASYEQ